MKRLSIALMRAPLRVTTEQTEAVDLDLYLAVGSEAAKTAARDAEIECAQSSFAVPATCVVSSSSILFACLNQWTLEAQPDGVQR